MKRIYFTVTNDLVYDQRMIRICRTLASGGYSVVLVGRRLPGSIPLRKEPFEQKRLRCVFRHGKAFYMEFNLRLFLFLLFRRMDGICAIDLDTILPGLWVSRWKKIPRIYDAHELFTEMKEVIARPAVQRVWKKIEHYAVPQYIHGYTVSRSIAEEFHRRYGVHYELIRNVPLLQEEPGRLSEDPASRPSVSITSTLPSHQLAESIHHSSLTPGTDPVVERHERFILYQGAVNEARGLESLIGAMRQVDSRLLVCGDGPRMAACRQLTKQYGLDDKIVFRGLVEPAALKGITATAYVGINLVERIGLNQYYSLANKFFDYIHAALPQLTMDFPEYRSVQDRLPIGLLIEDTGEKKIADALNNLLENDVLYGMFKENCRQARLLYNWQEEEIRLLRFYQKIFG